MNRKLAAVLAFALVLVASDRLLAQKPELGPPFKNLQVLDKNISGKDLKATMEGFTEQLGVKCTFCHILDEYEKDEMGHKRDARKMIQLVQYMRANLAKYFKNDVKPPQISCWTCHRGKSEIDTFVP